MHRHVCAAEPSPAPTLTPTAAPIEMASVWITVTGTADDLNAATLDAIGSTIVIAIGVDSSTLSVMACLCTCRYKCRAAPYVSMRRPTHGSTRLSMHMSKQVVIHAGSLILEVILPEVSASPLIEAINSGALSSLAGAITPLGTAPGLSPRSAWHSTRPVSPACLAQHPDYLPGLLGTAPVSPWPAWHAASLPGLLGTQPISPGLLATRPVSRHRSERSGLFVRWPAVIDLDSHINLWLWYRALIDH